MQAIEVIVFLVFAIITASLIFYAMVGIDLDILRKDDTQGFKKVNTEGFVSEAVQFWRGCGMGELNKSLTLYISGGGELNKSAIFSYVKKINLCDTLQSKANKCGMQEHVEMPSNMTLPRVIRLECNSSSQKLMLK